MKPAIIAALSLIAYAFGLTLGQTDYECKPYKPTEECEAGLYRIYFFEQSNSPAPHALAESHCVAALPGRHLADTVRLTTYSRHGMIKHVTYLPEAEFPTRFTKVCRIE